MDGKDLIIESINASSEKFATALVRSANEEKEEKLEQIKQEQQVKMQKAIEKAHSDAELIVSRKLSVAQLEASKIELLAKQKLIDSVYQSAKTRILNMTDNVYRDFVFSYIKEYAENGDIVIVAKRDEKRITEQHIDDLASSLNIVLSYSCDTHDGMGGVILSNKKYDKNLTLESILSSVRQETESKVIKILFGKGK